MNTKLTLRQRAISILMYVVAFIVPLDQVLKYIIIPNIYPDIVPIYTIITRIVPLIGLVLLSLTWIEIYRGGYDSLHRLSPIKKISTNQYYDVKRANLRIKIIFYLSLLVLPLQFYGIVEGILNIQLITNAFTILVAVWYIITTRVGLVKIDNYVQSLYIENQELKHKLRNKGIDV